MDRIIIAGNATAAIILVSSLAACLLTSCATPARHTELSWDKPPTPSEVAKWREKNGLTVASESEIAEAKKRESSFVNGSAADPFGGLSITFQCGSRVGSRNTNLSTTSLYILRDANGRELASGPACMTKGDSAVQRAWFSPDGNQAIVFEYVRECNGPPPLTILFHEDSESPGLWHTRFLALPDFMNVPFDEGAHSECRGFLGDELLIDATTDGTISKKKISDLKERYPFPFTVG
jgi:hypothetical protein